MQCPVCTTENLTMSERQGVEIDYCPKCRGVWLDRGELDKLIEKSGSARRDRDDDDDDDDRRRQAPRRHEDEYHHAPRYGTPYPHKKKKSILGEIFDF